VILAIKKLQDAAERLREGVRKAKSPLEIDGTIQRFESTFELLWKTLKVALEYYGVRCNNPRICIKQAFKNSLIDDDGTFLDMLNDRNKTEHLYSEATSREIFERIKEVYMEVIDKVVHNLRESIKP
jgi:nucleotidyltransferase substrate binding protein (TIGR01987 family)